MKQYLSREWIDEQHEMLPVDDSNCGGWSWDPPCGGCGACVHGQLSYAIHQEVKRARMFQAAGFEYASPSLVTIPYSKWGPAHESRHCHDTGEREGYFFPWEKKP